MSIATSAWLVLAFPLAGMLTIALGGKYWHPRAAATIGTLAIAIAFAFAVVTLVNLQGLPAEERVVTSSLWDLVNVGGLKIQLGIYVDPLSTFMALVVTGVSTLIHLYSAGYMKSDKGYVRYFAYLNFFVFSMLVLVMAGNMILLIIGWAFVGAASYMLISFWYRRSTATAAGIKAFVINVVGDVGLVLGTLFLFKTIGALDYGSLFESVQVDFAKNAPELVIAMILILVGAFAKSAQIPLHTWLPDAMEGPTPVSSLIHAATMVTAGVYLIGRLHPLFEWAPTAADVGAVIGAITLLVAGTIGLVMTDIKKVIAYSTMSQIGYMIMAVSAAAYVGGFFHLMTHAFFKALLFMAAGSLIGAMGGEQSLNKMSGWRPSRSSPASSRRTSCSTRSPIAAASTGCSTSSATSARSSPSSTPSGSSSGPSGASPASRPGRSRRAIRGTRPSRSTRQTTRSRTPGSVSRGPTTTSRRRAGRCGSRWRSSPYSR
jgi:NADH-quinone oxidoreductase subunit L